VPSPRLFPDRSQPHARQCAAAAGARPRADRPAGVSGLGSGRHGDLSRARQLVEQGRYQDAYELLQPFESEAGNDAAFNLLLARQRFAPNAPTRPGHCSSAALAARPGSVEAHLAWAGPTWRWATMPAQRSSSRRCFASTTCRRVFSSRRRSMPRRRWPTRRPACTDRGLCHRRLRQLPHRRAGGGPVNDGFFAARVGGNVNYELTDSYSLDGSLDYRFRNYDNDDRRNDSTSAGTARSAAMSARATGSPDCAAASATAATATTATTSACMGTTGSAWTRTTRSRPAWRCAQRRYPTGPLRERTRNIVELTGSWTHSLLDGKASFTLAGQAGREFNTERADGDANFFGLSPSLNFTVTDKLGGFVFGGGRTTATHRAPGRGWRPPGGHRYAQRQPVRSGRRPDLAVCAEVVAETPRSCTSATRATSSPTTTARPKSGSRCA